MAREVAYVALDDLKCCVLVIDAGGYDCGAKQWHVFVIDDYDVGGVRWYCWEVRDRVFVHKEWQTMTRPASALSVRGRRGTLASRCHCQRSLSFWTFG